MPLEERHFCGYFGPNRVPPGNIARWVLLLSDRRPRGDLAARVTPEKSSLLAADVVDGAP